MGTSPFANCSRNPTFWGVLEGPETGKVQGDRYQTRRLRDDRRRRVHRDDQQRVRPEDLGHVDDGVRLHLRREGPARGGRHHRRPAGLRPDHAQRRSDLRPAAGRRATSVRQATPTRGCTNADARNRVQRRTGSSYATFCTGDSYAGNGSGANPKHPMTTSFVLRQQVDSLDATAAPVQNDTSGSPCIKQYGSYVNAPSTDDLREPLQVHGRPAPTTPTSPGCSTTGSPSAASPRPGPVTTTSRSVPT